MLINKEVVKMKRFDKALNVQAVKMVTEEDLKAKTESITKNCSLKLRQSEGIESAA